jgi:prepilin signal peptidase PulO-like enzyme (type II secretory pathway)
LPWLPPLPVAARSFALLAGLALAAMLGVAAWLTPNEQGFGTHQQLGLPRCSVIEVFHIRCPACGMTTSWAYTVRGQLWRAASANCGGTLLAVSAIVLAPWLLASAVRGRWLGGPPSPAIALTLAACVLGVTLLDWSVRLLTR